MKLFGSLGRHLTSAFPALAAFGLVASIPVSASARAGGEATDVMAQLEIAQPLAKQARAIVAIRSQGVAPVDPAEKPTRMQDYVVHGTVAECLKGSLKPPGAITYRLTSEGRPERLTSDHIAFLRKGARRGWIAVDGPVFRDSPTLRLGVRRITGGCRS